MSLKGERRWGLGEDGVPQLLRIENTVFTVSGMNDPVCNSLPNIVPRKPGNLSRLVASIYWRSSRHGRRESLDFNVVSFLTKKTASLEASPPNKLPRQIDSPAGHPPRWEKSRVETVRSVKMQIYTFQKSNKGTWTSIVKWHPHTNTSRDVEPAVYVLTHPPSVLFLERKETR